MALRIKIGIGENARDIDRAKFDDLAEYVREREHRERTFIPLAPTKMDVRGVNVGENSSAVSSLWDIDQFILWPTARRACCIW